MFKSVNLVWAHAHAGPVGSRVPPKGHTHSPLAATDLEARTYRSHICQVEYWIVNSGTVALYYRPHRCCIGETCGSHKDRASQGNHEARRRANGASPLASSALTGGAANKRREAGDRPWSPADPERPICRSSSTPKRPRCVILLFEVIVSN